MSSIWQVAVNTFREAIRNRVLYMILFFAVAVILGAELIGMLALGARQRIVEDLGLAAVQVFGVTTCIFLGISLLSREIERRTIYVVLGRPVSRAAFVLGKGLGLYLTVLAVTSVISVVFAAYMLLRFHAFDGVLVKALAMFAIEFLVITAVALLTSAFTTPLLAALLTVTVFLIGHLTFGFKLLARQRGLEDTFVAKLGMFAYYAIPNLERFNLKTEAIHRDVITLGDMALSTGYGLAWTAVLLVAAVLVFERRDFV